MVSSVGMCLERCTLTLVRSVIPHVRMLLISGWPPVREWSSLLAELGVGLRSHRPSISAAFLALMHPVAVCASFLMFAAQTPAGTAHGLGRGL
eukprot:1150018-Pelagomonas_calceolata.AAC.3